MRRSNASSVRWLLVLSLLALSACATGGGERDAATTRDVPAADASIDATTSLDAPFASDAFSIDDAFTPDAYSVDDAFSEDDAFVEVDAPPAIDAFVPGADAFAFDAFVPPPDAFVPPDAYAPPDAYVPPDAYLPACTGQLDCSACTGGHCVLGACSMTNPTTLAYDFEAGLPTGWTNGMGSTASWTIDTTMPRGGARALRSGVIGHSAQSRVGFSLTLASAATLSFWMRTSTESCCDHGELWVDGVRVLQREGTTSWTQLAADLPAGFHSIEFRYTKDGSVVAGSDAVWIDDVTLGPPSDPNTGFESASLPAGYASTGTAWTSVATMPYAGTRAAQSGAIGHSATSTLARSVTLGSAQTFSFWYRTSTEATYDWLEIWIDGTRRDRWSGTTAWTMAAYMLTAGTHAIEWRYVKDASATGGSDAVWIDEVSFGPAPVGGPLCGP